MAGSIPRISQIPDDWHERVSQIPDDWHESPRIKVSLTPLPGYDNMLEEDEPVFTPSKARPEFSLAFMPKGTFTAWYGTPVPDPPTPDDIAADIEKMRRILR